MKKSKRVLASVMSALLVLPSLALPFSGTAEGAAAYPNADPDEPYYVVGRFQAKGTKVEGASEVQENTGSDAETYPNKVTMGNVRVTAEEPIDLTGWNTDNLALVMDVTYTRGDGKTGNGALDKTGNQMLHVNGTDNKVVAQMTGQPYLTYFTTGYGNSAGKTITYIVPWNYKHTDNNKTSFVKNAEATQLSNIMWQVYNDSWKVDIDGNGKYDDAFELKVAIENARIVDTTLDGEGNKNGIVMDFTGLNTVEVNNAQGQGTPNMFPWAPYKTNNIIADMKAEDLQLGFDVMYGGEADPTLIKNGQIRFSALVDDVATEYNYDAWGNGKVTEKDTWYHFDFKLSDFYRNVKSQDAEGKEITVKTYDLNPMNIQRMLIFNYNDDGNKPLDTKVKNLRIIDTTQLVVPVDRTALDEAVAAAEAKLTDGKTYTADTLQALNTALDAAKAVAEDADQAAVDAAAKALTDAIAGLVEESTGDDGTPITIDTPSATGHALNISQSIDPAIALNPDKEAYLNFKIRLDKTEDFPETVKDEWGSWLNYIKNGSLKVNGSDVTALTATIGVLKDMKLGEDLDVSVKIPQTVVAQGISSVEFLMYNDLHNFAKAKDPDNADNYTEDNEGSRGVQLSVSDMKVVVGADVEKPDPNAKMIWSAVKGDQTDLLGGTQVYVDWKAADGCSKDNQEGGGVDLSGTAANGANKNYNLQLKFSFKNVNLPEGVESVEQLIKTVFVRLRSTRIDGAEQAADGINFTLGAGGVSADQDGVYFINIPLSSITTANINWSDVKELIFRAEIADGFAVEAAGGTRVENPYFALNISEARVYDNDPEHPDVVNYDALKEVIAAAEAKLTDGKLYTPDSLANLNTALAAAKDALTTTNQDKIDAAAESLKVAMEKLQETVAYGDVNGDGKVDIVDALMALQASAEKIELTEEQTTLADIDADGTVSAADALMILKVATGAMDRDALL